MAEEKKFRVESDLLGELKVPADALYGVQTQRFYYCRTLCYITDIFFIIIRGEQISVLLQFLYLFNCFFYLRLIIGLIQSLYDFFTACLFPQCNDIIG